LEIVITYGRWRNFSGGRYSAKRRHVRPVINRHSSTERAQRILRAALRALSH
jgi:hypothetical protein